MMMRMLITLHSCCLQQTTQAAWRLTLTLKDCSAHQLYSSISLLRKTRIQQPPLTIKSTLLYLCVLLVSHASDFDVQLNPGPMIVDARVEFVN